MTEFQDKMREFTSNLGGKFNAFSANITSSLHDPTKILAFIQKMNISSMHTINLLKRHPIY